MKLLILVLSFTFCTAYDLKVKHKTFEPVTDESFYENIWKEDDRNSRIINGNNATDGQFPYSARVTLFRTDGRITRCSGSIISTNFILSAGHCIDERFDIVTVIRFDVGTANVDAHRTTVDAVESWWLDASEIRALDLAIYRLERHLTFNNLISSVRLPRRAHERYGFVGYPTQIIGWGTDNTGSSARILQYGNFLILSNTVCGERFTEFETCSIPNDWHPDLATQGGDSGGPEVTFEAGSNVPTQVGIHVRWRRTGGRDFYVATRVSLFLDFINEITGIAIRS